MRLAFVVFCAVIGPIAALGCGARWSTSGDYVAQTNTDPASAYAKVLQVIADKGYHIVEQRDADRYVRVRAHIDENFVDRQSFIAAQVDPAGSIKFTPSGHLVRGDKVHKKLAQELLDFQYATRGDLGPGAAPASTSPSATTAELPPTPPATPSTELPAVAPQASTAASTKPTSAPKHATAAPSKPPTAEKPKPASDDDWVSVP
jgi:hypothetical protein